MCFAAGPLFDGPPMNFFNLELSDTNEVDGNLSFLEDSTGFNYVIDPP